MSDSDGDLRDDLIFCVPGYVKVCWFTAEGKEICFGLPTCDFKEPSIPSELPGHGPWPGHGPFPIITEGHSEVEETPRPVPWVNDLSRIARAWGDPQPRCGVGVRGSATPVRDALSIRELASLVWYE